jgi:hypothetical protein
MIEAFSRKRDSKLNKMTEKKAIIAMPPILFVFDLFSVDDSDLN